MRVGVLVGDTCILEAEITILGIAHELDFPTIQLYMSQIFCSGMCCIHGWLAIIFCVKINALV